MLKHSKISQYKIKKILKNFVEDYSATESSELTKLSRNTTDRYYNIFRKACLSILYDKIRAYSSDGEYIGVIKGEFFKKECFNIYKINEKTFIFGKCTKHKSNTKNSVLDKDFSRYLSFVYKRFAKFHGFSDQGYYYQLIESVLRYNSTEKELFDNIWKSLQKPPPPRICSLSAIKP